MEQIRRRLVYPYSVCPHVNHRRRGRRGGSGPIVSICNSYETKPGLHVTDRDIQSASLANISICNIYRAKLPLRVTDRDKRSARFTNVSICNSYQVNRLVTVTDRDKRTNHQTRQATKRTGRPGITAGTSGPVKHQLGKLNQQIAASTLRPGP